MTKEERREYFKRPEVREKINKRRQTPKYRDKARRSWLLRTYGITLEEYNKQLELQDGKCAICNCLPETSFRGTLGVDHDHITGQVRGLLCRNCNQAIGLLQDSPVVLKQATDYLIKYKLKQ